MKIRKRSLTVVLAVSVVLAAVFLAGRYGWKVSGFRACQGAGITEVEVDEKTVHITGFYPGSFPEGFCGYYAKEQDGRLYVGFRFSAVFGFFETGDFDVTIPVTGEIREVILKISMNETIIWQAGIGALAQSMPYGIYVKLESTDLYSVEISYKGFSGAVGRADSMAMEGGEYCFMDNDIMMAAKDADAPVPFTVIVKDMDGNLAASGEFSFDANMERMYLTVTADGRILEDTEDTKDVSE